MIRTTHARHPRGTVVAYSDNSAVIEGATVARFYPRGDGVYRYQRRAHAHPDEGRDAQPSDRDLAVSRARRRARAARSATKARPAAARSRRRASPASPYRNLRIPGFVQPWERDGIGAPARIASPLQIMLEGPIGGAAFNNEFGRPNLAGYFRTFEQRGRRRSARLSQADHDRRRRRQHRRDAHAQDAAAAKARSLVQLGGPGMLIGLGGGAASSMDTGTNQEDLDFDSVQRGNAEIERRAQEVIDRCWALGDGESDPVDPRRRRGRAFERAAGARAWRRGAAAASTCARFRTKSPACRRCRSGATRRRSATCSRSRPSDLAAFRGDLRARALPVRGRGTRDGRRPARRSTIRTSATRPVDMALDGAARQAAADAARRGSACAASCRRSSSRGIDARGGRASACCGCRRSPTRRSSSRSATAASAACTRATRWSGRGRCRSPTSR